MRLNMTKRFLRAALKGKIKQLYKAIFPMAAILSLVASIVLVLSSVETINASSLFNWVIDINSISEPLTSIILGFGLIGLAKISRKKFKS